MNSKEFQCEHKVKSYYEQYIYRWAVIGIGGAVTLEAQFDSGKGWVSAVVHLHYQTCPPHLDMRQRQRCDHFDHCFCEALSATWCKSYLDSLPRDGWCNNVVHDSIWSDLANIALDRHVCREVEDET
jgi:hypothetical protein